MLAAADSAAPPRAPPTPSPAAAAAGEGVPPLVPPCPELPVLPSARQALADAVARAAAAMMLTRRAHCRAAEHSAQHAVRQAALRLLREMRLATWAACAFCYKINGRAAASGSAVTRCLDAARRFHVLLLCRSPPHALTGFDVGISPKGALSFRDARGVIGVQHPAAAHDERVPVGRILRADRTVGEPLSPPPGSVYELVLHASSGAARWSTTNATSAERSGSPLQGRPRFRRGRWVSQVTARLLAGLRLALLQCSTWKRSPSAEQAGYLSSRMSTTRSSSPHRDRKCACRPVDFAARRWRQRLRRQPDDKGDALASAEDLDARLDLVSPTVPQRRNRDR